MSEGLNLQDVVVVVNYDLHRNPARLIQRVGRIDRIGSVNDEIWGFNFLPELELERQLGLQAVLQSRIQEIHDSIGEDSAILDKSEQLTEEAMFCIYENKKGGNQLSFFEKDEGDLLDLNEAEEMLRSLRTDDPDEFNRIVNLRDAPAVLGKLKCAKIEPASVLPKTTHASSVVKRWSNQERPRSKGVSVLNC